MTDGRRPGESQGPDARERLAGSFTVGADRYARLRPGYPEEAASFMVGEPPRDVVDVGAGSGKFTAVLAGLGHRVTAVEPSEAMRAQLRAALPGVPVQDGTGEATGLPDACADVITFAQSWHWVDVAAASAEVARVLRPGGALGLVWNVFDVSVPWLDRFEEAMHTTPMAWPRGRDAEDQASLVGPVGGFGPARRHTVSWTDRMLLGDLVDLVTTRSYYLASPAHEQRAVAAHVRRTLVEDHPGVGVEEAVDVAYRTVCVRYDLG